MLPELNVHNEGHGATQWWALYTRHQHEKSVADMLSMKGFDVFLPLYDSVRIWGDRKKTLSLPLFPSYVFVRGSLGSKLQVLSTPGIHMVLCHGERVAAIPDTEIEAVRRVLTGPSQVEPHPFLRCGERVRVKRGALEGLEGILTRKKSIFRMVLTVEMLAQAVAVEVNATDVEPLKPQPSITNVSAPVASSRIRDISQAFVRSQQKPIPPYAN